MAYDVSPYLLLPRRDLPTACRQIREAKGIFVAPCGACPLSDMCKSPGAKAVALLPEPANKNTSQSIAPVSGRREAA